MFGLLKYRSHDPGHRAEFRKSYCGTCKAIGAMYGHKERLVLNYDVVFLSELLATMSDNPNDFAAISVNRCFSLPKHAGDIPDFLVYAASVNMLLAGIKVQDNAADSGLAAPLWRAAAFWQRRKFEKARQQLERWGLSRAAVDDRVQEHQRREREALHLPDMADACRYHAEMTGLLSGDLFRHASGAVGKPEAAEHLFQIGKAYGETVYLVDAVKDYEKDLKKGDFNFLLTGSGKPDTTLSVERADGVYEQIAAQLLIIRHHIFQLPIAAEKQQLFAQRVDASVHRALGKAHGCATGGACSSARMSIGEKYKRIYQRAQWALAPANRKAWRMAFTTVAAAMVALVLLALPLRVDASLPGPSEPTSCGEEVGNACCDCCCDSICEAICGPDCVQND